MNELKGLILAAGRGTRLLPLTSRRTKPLLPLAGQPLIAYPLQKLMLSGITEIGIVAGDNEAELRQGLANVPAHLAFVRQSEPLGLAHAVNAARGYTGDSDFVLMFCDNIFSEPLCFALAEWEVVRRRAPDTAALIHVIECADPRAFGVAVVDGDGAVLEMEEKPAQPKSNLAVVGIDFLTPVIYDAIARIKPSARGELEITDALAELVRMGHRVQARRLTGFWFDTGTFGDLTAALQPVMDEFGAYGTASSHPGCTLAGPVGIGRYSRVENCELTGPVIIGTNCQVTGSRLGPYTVVGNGCAIDNCTLSDCEVYAGTEIAGVTDSRAILDGDLRVDESTPPGT
ncbi:NTP transferase domain-containing protein [bacterium]|nr:NTP transferase domain-containing protein [bacterium]